MNTYTRAESEDCEPLLLIVEGVLNGQRVERCLGNLVSGSWEEMDETGEGNGADCGRALNVVNMENKIE